MLSYDEREDIECQRQAIDAAASRALTAEDTVFRGWRDTAFNVIRPGADLAARLLSTDVPVAGLPSMPFPALAMELPWSISRLFPGRPVLVFTDGDDIKCSALRNDGSLVSNGGCSVSQVARPPIRLSFARQQLSTLPDETVIALTMQAFRWGTVVRQLIVATMWWWSAASRRGALVRFGGQSKVRPGERSRPTVWRSRHSTQVQPQWLDAVQAAVHQGRALDHQHVVRGHFKQQRCGAGGRDRATVWIEPYWRGPLDAPGAARVYEGRS